MSELIELLKPIFPVFVVLITLIALSGIVVIVLSVFKAWAKHFYNIGHRDGMKAQASHDRLCREEMIEGIKSEIETEIVASKMSMFSINHIGLKLALEIIDKHISGKEKE